MKQPPYPDLENAADWCEACKGEDRDANKRVAAWLRDQAKKQLARRQKQSRKAIERQRGAY